jgi:xylulokinase
MEQDPKVWINAVDKTIRECLSKIGDRKHEIRAIGVSGQQHGLVVLNSSSQVIRPAKLWCDTSTSEQCREIIEEFGGESALIKLLGNTMLPGWTAPKILWLKQNEPENFASVESILLPQFLANRRKAHGVWRCLRDGPAGCEITSMVRTRHRVY